MISFLHTFNPSPILISFGFIHIYWYGFFIILGILSAISVCLILGKYYNISAQTIIDLCFYLIIGGILGARIYHIFLEFAYYLANPLSIFKIWQGGLAIHGAIIGGLIALWFYAKKQEPEKFWLLTSLTITALPLAQAFGRFGNFFNQELFGLPTNLPWGIFIAEANRPWQYINYEYFHPTFLYESLGNLAIFLILILIQVLLIKKYKPSEAGNTRPIAPYQIVVATYLFLYSLLRITLEFLRLDSTPVIFGWRFPQLVSLFIIALTIFYFFYLFYKKTNQTKTLDK
jgi:phosphatidylglycerol---prolipoprotein diacylglyceryl transferase